MSYRYYNFIGLPGRVFFDGETPDFCELFQPASGTLERDNANLLDMVTLPQSWEITKAEFDAMLQKATQGDSSSPLSNASK